MVPGTRAAPVPGGHRPTELPLQGAPRPGRPRPGARALAEHVVQELPGGLGVLLEEKGREFSEKACGNGLQGTISTSITYYTWQSSGTFDLDPRYTPGTTTWVLACLSHQRTQ